MKGHSHALSGAAAWLAVTSPSVIAIGGYEQRIAVSLGGAVLCAGAALLCDADHHSGTIAYSLPPVTKFATKHIEHLSGGHRHATHSWFGIAVFAALAWLSTLLVITIHGRPVALGAAIFAVPLVAFAAKALRLTSDAGMFLSSKVGIWVLSLGTVGTLTWFADYQWTWLVPCVAIGAFLHCLGDSLTVEGVPWLWPWNPAPPKGAQKILKVIWGKNGYFRFPILGHTESAREEFFSLLLAAYCIYQIVFWASIAAHTPIQYVI